MKFRGYHKLLPYLVAIASTGIALLLTIWLKPLMTGTLGAFFFVAVIVSTWYGGIYPGIVSVVLSVLAIDYFLIPPIYQWTPVFDDLLRLGIFTFVALIINLLSANLKASKHKVERLSHKFQEESAQRLQTALNAAQMGMWDWDMVTGKIIWSPEHEQLFGLAPGSFDGRYETFDSSLYPDDRQGLNQAIDQSLKNHTSYNHEFRIVWADGSIHWVEGRGKAFYNLQGQPVRMSGTIMAIDARKQAVETLQATSLQLRHQFEQQRLVSESTQRIRNSLNLQDILQTTVDEVREYLKTDRVIIFRFSPGWGGTTVVESVADEWMPILPLQIYDPCIGEEYVEPFKQGLVTAKSDIYNSGISPCHVEFLANLQVRANLVVPVIEGDRLWGLLAAHHCAAPRQWQDSEINLLQQLAAQVSVALGQSTLWEQVQTELAQRKQSEALLRLFAQCAPAGIAMLDRDMRYIMASQRWVDEYNLGAVESLIGRSHYEIFPDIPERWRQIHQRCLAGAIEKSEEDLFVRANGSQQWLFWEIHPWHTATGEIGGIIVFSVDISQRKQAELALQQLNAELEQRVFKRTVQLNQINDRLLEALLEQQHTQFLLSEKAQLLDLAHDTIMTCDLNWVITFWNQGAQQMYGWTPAEALGKETHTLLKTQFTQPLTEIQAQLFDQGYWEGELVHQHRNHQSITVASRWVLQKDAMGRPIKILEINNDITFRKQAEAALRQSEETFRSLSEFSPIGIFLSDIAGKTIYTNPLYQQIIGASAEEALGDGWKEFIHPDDRQWVFQYWSEVVAAGKEGIFNEVRYQDRQGKICYTQVRTAPIKSSDGTVILFVGTVEDITERRKIDQMKQEFISIVSHELRTPLTSIRGALGLVAAGIFDKKPEKMKNMIDIAARQSERLVRLVNDILDLRRLESGQTKFNFQQCAVAELIQQSVDVMRTQAEQNQITLSIIPCALEVWADADAIVQTITNLLSNAIKFSPPNSTITISAEVIPNDLLTEKELPFVALFSVQDQGRGIPEDKLESIFEQFQQVNVSDSREKGGTGLGLSICRSIIEQHGGKIWVQSVLNEGSTFYFTLHFNG
ncbi:PAS domain S-box protein [Phormidium sp. LEGE 05292]|uniref:PAS domain S-box protein n=1 Tax=[Phormidium] sp. LEGE 05292 TaxID=767427 RepID=UPI00188268D0|nr:PAS domain S-box protein [Phormidium sp. LEGE 05292]MBE9223899.1 PAS domain S-box protein [Phormidium sp. LEGE 05292]